MSICDRCNYCLYPHIDRSIDKLTLIPSYGDENYVGIFTGERVDMHICYRCLSTMQPKQLFIMSQSNSFTMTRDFSSINNCVIKTPAVLDCLQYTNVLSINHVDCRPIEQHIIGLIATNKMPATVYLIDCMINVTPIITAMALNTSIVDLILNNNYHTIDNLTDNLIKFINTNKTCHTLEFWACVDTLRPINTCLMNNYTLINLAEERYDVQAMYEPNRSICHTLKRNYQYTRTVMTRILIDIIIAMFPIIRQYEMCPYVVMEIFGYLQPHYDKFWHRELTDIAIEIIHNNKNESL